MTQIVCHRGALHHAPENTISSGLAALRLGGDIIELDVRQSADGVLYVLHDATIDRTTTGEGLIEAHMAAHLDSLDAGAWFAPHFTGEPLPRLDRFFDALRDWGGFYVENKSADPAALAKAIEAAGVADQTFTYSEDATLRAAMASDAPWLERMVNRRDIGGIEEAARDGAAILEFHAADFSGEGVEEARAHGLEVMVYTPENDPDLFQAALRFGVDYINTDYPEIVFRLREDQR